MDIFDENSPSKVFYEIGAFTVFGFNNAITKEGKTTQGVFSKWADSFTGMTPAMAFAVDTSALRYYDSASFTKSISPTVTAKSNVAVTASHGMDEEMRDAILQTAENTRRQADKREQTILHVDGREIAKTVETQERKNGYKFTS